MSDKKTLTRDEAQAKIRDALKSGIAFQCCFCHNAIEGSIHALVFIAHWDGPKEDQKSQQWFCHAECFIKATGEPIHVLKADT